mgnify:CR=1 FL=1
MLLLPSAKEAGIKEMIKNKDNSNGMKNRVILIPCGKFSVISHTQSYTLSRLIFERKIFHQESEYTGKPRFATGSLDCKLPFPAKTDMGKGRDGTG